MVAVGGDYSGVINVFGGQQRFPSILGCDEPTNMNMLGQERFRRLIYALKAVFTLGRCWWVANNL